MRCNGIGALHQCISSFVHSDCLRALCMQRSAARQKSSCMLSVTCQLASDSASQSVWVRQHWFASIRSERSSQSSQQHCVFSRLCITESLMFLTC